MAYETILYEKSQGICTITLNRPERMNALSSKLLQELEEAMDEIIEDDEIAVVIVTGAPRPDGRPCFSAGADLKEMATGVVPVVKGRRDTMDDQVYGMRMPTGYLEVQRVFEKLEKLPKPTIAAVDGVCTAGGIELALSCDMIVAAQTAQLSDMHLKNLGTIGGAGSYVRLTRRIGAAKTKEIAFTGDPIDGQEAWRIGLANLVAPPEELMARARELASKMAGAPLVALKMGKACIDATVDMDLDDALRYSYLCLVATAAGAQVAEAYVEKRSGKSSE